MSQTRELYTHRFDLSSVQFSPVQHDRMNGITCPGSLDGGGEHVQEILEKQRWSVIISHIFLQLVRQQKRNNYHLSCTFNLWSKKVRLLLCFNWIFAEYIVGKHKCVTSFEGELNVELGVYHGAMNPVVNSWHCYCWHLITNLVPPIDKQETNLLPTSYLNLCTCTFDSWLIYWVICCSKYYNDTINICSSVLF